MSGNFLCNYIYFGHDWGAGIRSLKKSPYDVIKIREMRKKTSKKEIDNPSFYDVTC